MTHDETTALLREALEALTYLIADTEAAHTSGALSNPPPTAHEMANLGRARAAADKIRAALTEEKQT